MLMLKLQLPFHASQWMTRTFARTMTPGFGLKPPTANQVKDQPNGKLSAIGWLSVIQLQSSTNRKKIRTMLGGDTRMLRASLLNKEIPSKKTMHQRIGKAWLQLASKKHSNYGGASKLVRRMRDNGEELVHSANIHTQASSTGPLCSRGGSSEEKRMMKIPCTCSTNLHARCAKTAAPLVISTNAGDIRITLRRPSTKHHRATCRMRSGPCVWHPL